MEIPSTLVDEFQQNQARRNIAVIGAGPGGLAAVKLIKDTQQFKDGLWTVTVFEARDKIGGVWVPAPPTQDPPVTPLYDSLTTNLPHPSMAFSEFAFPPGTALFPPASAVLAYLESYAATFDLLPHIRLNSPVLSVARDTAAGKWTVTVRSGASQAEESDTFDLVIVANGHHRAPRIPNTPGLAQWLAAKKASHAAYYRNPADFGDARTVLVVGSGPSGQDLVADLVAAGRTVVHSSTGAVPEDLRDGRHKVRGRVAQYLDPSSSRIVFEDGSEEGGIDRVVLATGYKVDFPFLAADVLRAPALPPAAPPLPHILHNSTYHVFPLARHVFPLVDAAHVPPASLAFVGLPVRVAPLPLMEAQVRAVLHAFAHPAALDPAQEAVAVVSRYEALRAEIAAKRSAAASAAADPAAKKTAANPDDLDRPDDDVRGDALELAIARAWHRFDEPEAQYAYRDELHAFAGHPERVQPWELEVFNAKGVLREEWRDLERTGHADEWVRGVGAAGGKEGLEEWLALMKRLQKRAEERHPERSRL
ncbi:FAD/NAD-P-binding domain-containing protein [Trametes elegans]|nr:FAD/NAD-P-binding domain-containing protein [Trametes elegans]